MRWNPFTMLLLLLGMVKGVTPSLPRAALAPVAACVMIAAAVFAIARNLT